MEAVIPFVGQVSAEDEKNWIDALSGALPNEQIIPFADLSESQRTSSTIAIVANPSPEDLAKLPNLVWIQSVWAGVERLLGELRDRPFEIVRMVDPEMSRTMAEAVLSWTLYLHRDMPAYAKQQRERKWVELPYTKPSQKTVGILGLGKLGKVAGRKLAEAGFNVMGWSRRPEDIQNINTKSGDDGLKQVISQSDIIVLLLPLSDTTRGLLNKNVFDQMRIGTSLINFSRGPIIDDDDLIEALDTGRIDHAVLDVFHQEPLPQDNPFWGHERVTVLPHISAPTDFDTATKIVSKNISRYRKIGILPMTVDKERGY
ncbi:MAG: glyoxylate/hydroxypyruvate reductase A [Sneathiella sp.]|nr:glyoxylate/hydroxypyruvate reductase A [Sneathiella sp.]